MPADDPDAPAEQQPAELPCPPCRGTGSVVSHADEKETTVTCPWCEGSGRFLSGHDAQGHWRDDAPEGGDGAEDSNGQA